MRSMSVIVSVPQCLRLAASSALTAIILLQPGGAHAQAEGLTASYTVNLVGFSLGTATLSGKFGPDGYSVQAYAKLTGLAQAMTSAKGAAQSNGAIRGGRILPSGYATTSSNSRETRTVRIGMNAGNVRAVDISPPIQERPGRIPLQAGHQRGIIDPLSALVFPVGGSGPIGGEAACNRKLPVFDGYTRFDITLQYSGMRTIQTKGYSGPVVVCKARYRPIAGHRPGRKATQFMIGNTKMEVWLVPLAKARVLAPYKIAVNTMAGMLTIQARALSIAGEAPTSTVNR